MAAANTVVHSGSSEMVAEALHVIVWNLLIKIKLVKSHNVQSNFKMTSITYLILMFKMTRDLGLLEKCYLYLF